MKYKRENIKKSEGKTKNKITFPAPEVLEALTEANTMEFEGLAEKYQLTQKLIHGWQVYFLPTFLR